MSAPYSRAVSSGLRASVMTTPFFSIPSAPLAAFVKVIFVVVLVIVVSSVVWCPSFLALAPVRRGQAGPRRGSYFVAEV